jgi:hypothetical protein
MYDFSYVCNTNIVYLTCTWMKINTFVQACYWLDAVFHAVVIPVKLKNGNQITVVKVALSKKCHKIWFLGFYLGVCGCSPIFTQIQYMDRGSATLNAASKLLQQWFLFSKNSLRKIENAKCAEKVETDGGMKYTWWDGDRWIHHIHFGGMGFMHKNTLWKDVVKCSKIH